MKRMSIEDAALAFVIARNERRDAKKAYRRWLMEHIYGSEEYPCEHANSKADSCLFTAKPVQELCGLCTDRRPLHQRYVTAVRQHQTKLRTLENVVNRTLATKEAQ